MSPKIVYRFNWEFKTNLAQLCDRRGESSHQIHCSIKDELKVTWAESDSTYVRSSNQKGEVGFDFRFHRSLPCQCQCKVCFWLRCAQKDFDIIRIQIGIMWTHPDCPAMHSIGIRTKHRAYHGKVIFFDFVRWSNEILFSSYFIKYLMFRK